MACEKSQPSFFFVNHLRAVPVKNERGYQMSAPEKNEPAEGTTTTTATDQPVTDQAKTDHMIPKTRFDEVNNAKKELEARLAAMEKAAKESEEQRLIEKESFKELAEKRQAEIEALRPKAAVAEESEITLKAVLEAQVAELPESVRDMVPEGTTSYKLKWLAQHKAKLMKPAPYDIGAGRMGGGAPDMVTLTPEEIAAAKRTGVKPEDYAKNL
jgi:ribonucleoside-triphosphate reductase